VKEYYYDVVAGLLRRSADSPVTHSRHIVEAYIHPEFEGETFSNDIALAKVYAPLLLPLVPWVRIGAKACVSKWLRDFLIY
jgi:hypothetical protein